MIRNIHDYDPSAGMAFQGDVSIIPVPRSIALDLTDEIQPIGGHTTVPLDSPFAYRVRELLDYDRTTGKFTWRKTMGGTAWDGTDAGAKNSAGYILIKVDGKKYQASRLAWVHVHGVWPPAYLDHINGDKTDNRLANLRMATPRQNRHNSRAPANSTSGVKGVFWNRARSKWQARICLDAKTRQHLGYFNTIEEAKDAYAAAEVGHRREFAVSNRKLILMSGEVTGHHHAIALLDRPPETFVRSKAADTLMADALAGKIAIPTAKLYRAPSVTSEMQRLGTLTRADLIVALLVVDVGPMCLSHEEHDTIRIPPGAYLIGRQVESAGAEERAVRD